MIKDRDYYEILKNNIDCTLNNTESKVILIASAESGEGKTTLVEKLAKVISESGKNVIMVDANLRKPALHSISNVENQTGFVEVVKNDVDLKLAIRNIDENLDILTSGTSVENPALILGLDRMEYLFTELRTKYDYVLIDSSEVLSFVDAKLLSKYADGTILVARKRLTGIENLKLAKKELERNKTNIIGSVLNIF